MAFEESVFHGVWRIVECVSLAGVVETTGIEGTEFCLDENGDVTWKVSEDAESMVFFTCETYEITPATNSGGPGESALLKFIGTFAGHIIEFKVEVTDDLMLLTYEKCCMLQCQKIASNDPKQDVPYSYISALEQGFFSDLTIKANTGKEFPVHSIILRLSLPEIDWSNETTPLSGLEEDVLQAVLHYLYCECLPPGLTDATAKACLKNMSKIPGFLHFCQLCETFRQNTALKRQIETLITDMHSCCDRIIELFSGRPGFSSQDESVSMDTSLWNNPAKLCYTVRQGLKEAAIACAKLLLLCDLFSKRKCELSRQERHEIMKQAKSRMPVFLKQLHKFMMVLKQQTQTLTAHQRYDIASYLVPEIVKMLDTVSHFALATKAALEQEISSNNADHIDRNENHEKHDKGEKSRKGNVGEMLGRTLKHALHARELKKLKKFHDKTTTSFQHLLDKKEAFNTMSEADNVRYISKYLEQIVDELPVAVMRLEELIGALEQKVPWPEWKYLFKMATSKVSWALSKVLSNRSALQTMIDEVCDIVRSDQFTATLGMLGLHPSVLDANPDGTSTTDGCKLNKLRYDKLSPVESLCVPPFPKDSKMASRAINLLRKGEGTDMEFEIISPGDGGDIVIDHTGEKPVTSIIEDTDEEVIRIPCHRAIVAAHCDWFRRALLSGMRESIDKKIIVHDVQPFLFHLFLEALYSGQLDTAGLSTEQLVDMMTLCDRYEMDTLKLTCECALKRHVDEDTALYLLSIADQLGCISLQEYTLSFIAAHPQLAHSDVFDELSDKLKEDVDDAIAWHGLDEQRVQEGGGAMDMTPSSVSSVSEMEELLSNIDIADRVPGQDLSPSMSSENLHVMENEELLNSCLLALHNIVGEAVPREELVRVALAADYDVNRAVNYYFSS